MRSVDGPSVQERTSPLLKVLRLVELGVGSLDLWACGNDGRVVGDSNTERVRDCAMRPRNSFYASLSVICNSGNWSLSLMCVNWDFM